MELLARVLQKDYDNGYKYVTHAVGNDIMIYFMYNDKIDKTRIIKYFKNNDYVKIEELDYNLFRI